MAVNVNNLPKGNASNRVEQPVLEPGTYPARLVQVIDYGLQAQKPYQGQEKAPAYRLGLTYELVDVFMVDKEGNEQEDKPRWVSEEISLYPLDNDKATSTKRYNALDPTDALQGDFGRALGTPVNITVVNNKKGDKVYTNVAGISAMRKRDADKCPELKNEPKLFDLDAPDLEIFRSLPEWIQEKIKGNLNYAGSKLAILIGGGNLPPDKAKEEPAKDEDDDIPF